MAVLRVQKGKITFQIVLPWEIFDHITNSAFLANQKICRAPTKKLSARDLNLTATGAVAPCSVFRHRACIVGAPQPPRLCDRQVVCRCNRQPTRKLSSHQIPGSTNLLAVKSSSLSHNLTSCVASGRDACHTLPRPLTLVLCKLANRFTAQRWTGWTKERSCSRIGRTISPSKRTGRPCRCV